MHLVWHANKTPTAAAAALLTCCCNVMCNVINVCWMQVHTSMIYKRHWADLGVGVGFILSVSWTELKKKSNAEVKSLECSETGPDRCNRHEVQETIKKIPCVVSSSFSWTESRLGVAGNVCWLTGDWRLTCHRLFGLECGLMMRVFEMLRYEHFTNPHINICSRSINPPTSNRGRDCGSYAKIPTAYLDRIRKASAPSLASNGWFCLSVKGTCSKAGLQKEALSPSYSLNSEKQ